MSAGPSRLFSLTPTRPPLVRSLGHLGEACRSFRRAAPLPTNAGHVKSFQPLAALLGSSAETSLSTRKSSLVEASIPRHNPRIAVNRNHQRYTLNKRDIPTSEEQAIHGDIYKLQLNTPVEPLQQ